MIARYLESREAAPLVVAVEADIRRMYDQPRVRRAFNPLRPKAPKATGLALIPWAIRKMLGRPQPRPPVPPAPPQPDKRTLFPRADDEARARAFTTGLTTLLGRELARGVDAAEIAGWLRAARPSAADPKRDAALVDALFRQRPGRAAVLVDLALGGERLGSIEAAVLAAGAAQAGAHGYGERALAIATLFLQSCASARALMPAVLEHGWRAAMRLGRIDRALDLADRWIVAERTSRRGTTAKAAALATFDRDGAIALLRQAGAVADPIEDERAGRLLAELLLADDRLDEAESELRRVLPATLGPDSAEPLCVLQNIYTRRGVAADFVSPLFALQGSEVAWSPQLTVDGLVDATPDGGSGRAAVVTVVMPARDAAPFIDTAIAGVLGQSHHAIELIVVDDASSDATRRRVARWADRDPRVRLLANERSIGAFASRNAGIAAATGRYVAFCDADDLWLRSHLAEHLAALARVKDAQMSLSRWIRVDEGGMIAADMFGEHVAVCPQSMLVERRLFARVGRFDPVRFGADREFVDRVAVANGAAAIVTLPAILTIGRIHPAANSSRGAARALPLVGSPTRHRYDRAWADWHLELARAGRVTPAFARAGKRPFPAPLEMVG